MPVTVVTASALVLLLSALSVNVSRLRLRYRISFSNGPHKDLEAAVRAHGNTLEQVPVFVLLVLLTEWQSAPAPWLGAVALAFVVARLLYAFAVFSRRLPLRRAAVRARRRALVEGARTRRSEKDARDLTGLTRARGDALRQGAGCEDAGHCAPRRL